MVRRGLGKGSLRGVWLEQALSVKDCYLWLKSLSKNSCSIPYFQRSDVCLGSCNFSWKGWNFCCCGIIQFNIFPPFRTGFLSEKLADVPSIWNVFFVCFLPCNSKQNETSPWDIRWDTEEWHHCVCRRAGEVSWSLSACFQRLMSSSKQENMKLPYKLQNSCWTVDVTWSQIVILLMLRVWLFVLNERNGLLVTSQPALCIQPAGQPLLHQPWRWMSSSSWSWDRF